MGTSPVDAGDGTGCIHDDDERLYARRRASLYSTATAPSSRASSPTFSRRGSFPQSHDGLASTASALRLREPLRSQSDAGLIARVRDGSPSLAARDRRGLDTRLATYNHDGIIKYPSQYDARSLSLAAVDDAAAPQQLPPPLAHPLYTQKRHSFAAFKTTASATPSPSKMAAVTNEFAILPQVRLPSIDHGLPPISSADGGLIPPMRRGSLTDPLLHAHNSSSSSTANAGSLLAGPSGTSQYAPVGSLLSPDSSLKAHFANNASYGSLSGDSPRGGNARQMLQPGKDNSEIPLKPYSLPESKSGSYTSSALKVSAAASTSAAPPLFQKTAKTLFPQQHGDNNPSSSSSISPAGDANPNNTGLQGLTPSGASSMLGTKRKLEPLSESDTLMREGGEPNSGGDYFGSANIIRDPEPLRNPSAKGGVADMPINPAKRRASQPFHTTASVGDEYTAELLPTPLSMVYGNSAAGGSQSASLSERRSSNESSNDHVNSGTSKNAAYPMPLRSPPEGLEEKAFPNITPRQHYQLGDAREISRHQGAEGDHKMGYALPPTHLHQQQAAYYEPQGHTNGASLRARVPPPGSTLPPELRSKASAVFAGPADGIGSRPSYLSNGTPMPSAGSGGQSTASLHGERAANFREGSLHNSPSYPSHHQQHLQRQHAISTAEAQAASTSNLPYARSPALKVSHKIAERKRRKEMKELFDELRDSIPSMSTIAPHASASMGIDANGKSIPAPPPPQPPADVGGRGIKSSKWEVLAKAVEYIAKLQSENAGLSNSVLELQRLNQAFQDELAAIRSSSSGVSRNKVNFQTASGNTGVHGVEMDSFGDIVSNSGGMGDRIRFQQQQQPPRQEADQLYPQHQQRRTASDHPGPSTAASPSPGSIHAMPPFIHHSHSMPATLEGGGVSASSVHSSLPALPLHRSPVQDQVYPISAPPQLASHSFFGSNNNPSEHRHHPHLHQRFAQAGSTGHGSPHVQHSRHTSYNSNIGGAQEGNNGHFEQGGSAPPALQHHSHPQVQASSLGGTGQGESNHEEPPMLQHQIVQQTFAYQPSAYQHEMHIQPSGAQFGQQVRPDSMRSHHSNQSLLSGGQSHHSQSPQPVHTAIHHTHQHPQHHQQQQQHPQQQPPHAQEGWVGSPYQQQHQQQLRSGTLPPGSAQGTPMMSPLNPTH